MTSPVRASDTPFAVDVEQGKDYWWCACGQSKAQPFCDGSHKAAGEFSPVKFAAEVTSTVYFCGCKATRNQPLCDGSHKNPL
jgi:CDGSH-type Zn-finger protein